MKKQYFFKDGKYRQVYEVNIDELKELETIKLIEDTYQDSSKSNDDYDYFSVRAEKL